jgi:hypothetical protein
MNFEVEHELHKRRMSKNIGLGVVLAIAGAASSE